MYQCAFCPVRTTDLGLLHSHLRESHQEDLLRKNQTWYDPAERGHIVHHHEFGFLAGINGSGGPIWVPDISHAHNFPTADIYATFVGKHRKALTGGSDVTRWAGVDQQIWEYVPIDQLRLGDAVYAPWSWASYEGTVTKIATQAAQMVEVAWHKWEHEDVRAYETGDQWRKR